MYSTSGSSLAIIKMQNNSCDFAYAVSHLIFVRALVRPLPQGGGGLFSFVQVSWSSPSSLSTNDSII